MMEEYDVVRLTSAAPDVPVPVGATGTILIVFPGDSSAYVVEFTNDDGDSLGVFTVGSQYLAVVPAVLPSQAGTIMADP